MNFKFNTALLSSYGRSVLAGGLTLYMAGVTDPNDLWKALLAALVPVALRAVNPNDAGFGKIPEIEDVQSQIDDAVQSALEQSALEKAKAIAAEKAKANTLKKELDELKAAQPAPKKTVAKKTTKPKQ